MTVLGNTFLGWTDPLVEAVAAHGALQVVRDTLKHSRDPSLSARWYMYRSSCGQRLSGVSGPGLVLAAVWIFLLQLGVQSKAKHDRCSGEPNQHGMRRVSVDVEAGKLESPRQKTRQELGMGFVLRRGGRDRPR